MSSKKKHQNRAEGDLDHEALKGGAGQEPNFEINVNPVDPNSSTYKSDFDSRLDVRYAVRLGGSTVGWSKLRHYKSFQVNLDSSQLVIPTGSFVYIRGSVPTTPRPQSKGKAKAKGGAAATADEEVEYETWVAQVLECRAADGQNVFLRIVWLYWPDDLQGYGGRRDHHGTFEVVPSNDMQIINAITVAGVVEVERWDDAGDANHVSRPGHLYWRQTLNVYGGAVLKKQPTARKSAALQPQPAVHCVCAKPANPDHFLIRCGTCSRWMHEECIVERAVKEAPETEPTQNPALAPVVTVEEEEDNEEEETAKVDKGAKDNNTATDEAPHSLFARVMDKVLPKRDSASPAPKASQSSVADGKLPHPKKAGSNLTSTNGISESPLDKKRKFEMDDAPLEASPKKKAKGEKSKGKPIGGKTDDEFFEAKLTEPESEQAEVTPEIVISKHGADGMRRVWQHPIRCLFEDCGELVA